MLRRGFGLRTTLSDIARQWLGGQPQCTFWQSSCVLAKKRSRGSGSSSSSDDSDGEVGKGVDQKLKEAAEVVAQSIPKHGSKVQSDLLQQLQSFAKLSKDQADGVESPEVASKVSNLLSGMQVQKSDERRSGNVMQGQPRSGRSPQQPGFRRQPSQVDREKVKLFEGHSLGIFTTGESAQTSQHQVAEIVPEQRVSLWEKIEQEQLDMFSKQPPSNAYEEMIQWTQEGKLWQFPINNEQGMEEEANTGFHQHVFLEDQIRDFPRRGPIRHFIELVLIGLSKNPYLTVQQKHEHIDWFRQYFKEKQDVLEEALGKDGLIQTPDTKVMT